MIPSFRNRFTTYEEYGRTPFSSSFTEAELEGAVHLKCHMMESVILENIEGASFKIHQLPMDAQFSAIFGIAIDDLNEDNLLDLILVGNSMADENIGGYYDASFGNILINEGEFRFQSIPPSKSNFIADGDKKGIVRLSIDGSSVYVISENNGFLQAVTPN